MINQEMINKYVCEKGTELDEYIHYLVCEKLECNELSWQDIADLVEYWFGFKRSRNYYSKYCKNLAQVEAESEIEESENDLSDEIKAEILELQKERFKLQEEKTQNRAYVRRLAREDTIRELGIQAAHIVADEKPLLTIKKDKKETFSDKEAILLLSDWHYGIEIDNAWNKYNTDTCKERVNNLLDKTIHYCKLNKVSKIHVLNLGDMIAGRIHLTLRLQSRIDTLTQIMHVSEILAEFIHSLSKYFEVDYHSCIDNHSRIEPDKSDSLDLESLCRITDWYLSERLLHNKAVKVVSNRFGNDIITLDCKGHKVCGVHGDKDKPARVLSSISNFTRQNYDLVVMAHRHHFSADEECGTLLLCNGSVMGTDEFAQKLRLHSSPSQTLIISSDDNVAETIYRIVL